MLIDFRELLPKYGLTSKGICHVGGNVGEEFPVYMEMGINKQYWFEPNPNMFSQLEQNISSNPQAKAFMLCVGNENGNVILHESNNAGQSSSVLELGTHQSVHPEVYYIGDIEVEMVRLEDFLTEKDLSGVDILNADVQGFEMEVLKGAGELLRCFKMIYLEVNKAELYINCAMVEDIDEYLLEYGFFRMETEWCGNTMWGDAAYFHESLLNNVA